MQANKCMCLTGIALLATLFAPLASAQKTAGDWPMYRGNLGGTGYSSLKQINTGNVTNLEQAWSSQLTSRGGLEVTPIVVKGVMYLPGENKVMALEADTGKEIWHYDVTMAPTRGVAYWQGDKNNPPRIIFTTMSRKLIALDAATGKIV